MELFLLGNDVQPLFLANYVGVIQSSSISCNKELLHNIINNGAKKIFPVICTNEIYIWVSDLRT